MSSLTDVEKRYFEKLFEMSSGFVLDFSDSTFSEFFNRHHVSIHSDYYKIYGSSKAKKLRAFWTKETDPLVGKVLSEMLDIYVATCSLNKKEMDVPLLQKARLIVDRLLGVPISEIKSTTLDEFLRTEFSFPNIQKLPIEAMVIPIIEQRLVEARATMNSGAYLATIFLCGSVLEGVLLGAAQKEPARFNRSSASPKTNDGKVKTFNQWTLSEFIDVAYEIGVLKPDDKQFSHGLRNFRNYIHPYEQMSSGFSPDQHTAKVCFQVLKAALASLAGERK